MYQDPQQNAGAPDSDPFAQHFLSQDFGLSVFDYDGPNLFGPPAMLPTVPPFQDPGISPVGFVPNSLPAFTSHPVPQAGSADQDGFGAPGNFEQGITMDMFEGASLGGSLLDFPPAFGLQQPQPEHQEHQEQELQQALLPTSTNPYMGWDFPFLPYREVHKAPTALMLSTASLL
ncbi:hypothetical protein BU23DRAFT_569162 [Bimuria novae-zelandiae CBS 107.79]|uniref:Uncharacterized protein n=1 Tax=Bimuria novae-zelandiae CBS 107.79 TaxID=1447943 RepID=A0A6A5V564_9PLEO|nr:hypothetical protein BU23DRAFT_569162 [Bimuria novae-zelandiae CBS 107.79]